MKVSFGIKVLLEQERKHAISVITGIFNNIESYECKGQFNVNEEKCKDCLVIDKCKNYKKPKEIEKYEPTIIIDNKKIKITTIEKFLKKL